MTHQVNNIIPENSLHYASIPANRNTCLPTKLELAGRSIDQTQQFFIPNAFTNANFGRFEQSAMASFFFAGRESFRTPCLAVEAGISSAEFSVKSNFDPNNLKNNVLVSIFKWAFDQRGFLVAGALALSLISQGAGVACLDLGLVFLIVAVSSDGPKLLGHMGRLASQFEFLKTPAGKALLMALPVKTVTAMLGALNTVELAEVATHASYGLAGLAVGLTAWYGVEKVFNFAINKLSNSTRKMGPVITAVDFSILGLLLALGKDGEAIFGKAGTFVQEILPFAQEPWARGLIAILPIKTTTTLLLTKSSKERQQIALNGTRNMFVLTVFSSVIALSANASIGFYESGPIAMAIGFATYLSWDKLAGWLSRKKSTQL